MIVRISDVAGNAMLNVLSNMMDGGSIEIMTEDRVRLGTLRLSDPASDRASGGEITFNSIAEEDAAVMRGVARLARIVSSDGTELMMCDVGDPISEAAIKLNTIEIYPGGPIRINSFRLAMP